MAVEKPKGIDVQNQVEQWRMRVFGATRPEALAAAEAATVRKDQRALKASEQQALIAAFDNLISSAFLGPFVAIHADMSHVMHHSMGPVGAQRFLPWHRVYLRVLEQHIRALEPDFGIPYWDWSRTRSVPTWVRGYTPTVVVNGTPIRVVRQPGPSSQLPTGGGVRAILGNRDFTAFEDALETTHDGVHGWVGGTMRVINTAPADLLFWMHHANVDRIWASWQKSNPGKNPSLSGSTAVMDPWTQTETETRDIAALGYSYDRLP